MPLFASYRWRRRFIWLLLIAVLAVVGTALAIEFPNGKVTNEAPLSKRPIHIAPSGTPKTVRLTAAKKASALAVAGVFVHTAVARKHLDRSWPLLTPKLTQGLTRRQWDKGQNLPVVPYPVGQVRWDVDYSYANSAGLQIVLFPRHGAKLKPQVFLLDLKVAGKGNKRHWLVDAWNPTPVPGFGNTPIAGPTGRSTRRAAAAGGGPLSAAWLLLPIGLLSLVLLIPLGFVLLNWRRGRAIERDYLREQESRAYNSSSRPS